MLLINYILKVKKNFNFVYRTELLVEIKRNEDEEASDFQRVIWCPFIPDESVEEDQDEESDEENFSYLLVVTNGPLVGLNVVLIVRILDF